MALRQARAQLKRKGRRRPRVLSRPLPAAAPPVAARAKPPGSRRPRVVVLWAPSLRLPRPLERVLAVRLQQRHGLWHPRLLQYGGLWATALQLLQHQQHRPRSHPRVAATPEKRGGRIPGGEVGRLEATQDQSQMAKRRLDLYQGRQHRVGGRHPTIRTVAGSAGPHRRLAVGHVAPLARHHGQTVCGSVTAIAIALAAGAKGEMPVARIQDYVVGGATYAGAHELLMGGGAGHVEEPVIAVRAAPLAEAAVNPAADQPVVVEGGGVGSGTQGEPRKRAGALVSSMPMTTHEDLMICDLSPLVGGAGAMPVPVGQWMLPRTRDRLSNNAH